MHNTVAFTPNGLRYLVFPDPVEAHEEQIGSVLISTQPDPNKKASEGTVVAVGDGDAMGASPLSSSEIQPRRCCKYTIGDKLIYGQYSGYEQEFDGEKYKVLAESEILGKRIIPAARDSRTMAGVGEKACPLCGGIMPAHDPEAEVCNPCFTESLNF